jgi:hypothetical protein
MSSIASFYLLPTDKLIGLREVWPETYDYLNKHGEECFDYRWSGYCIAALMTYLKAKKKIDLDQSDYHLLFPGALHEGTWFLDKSLKDKYLKRLDPTLFSQKELIAGAKEWFGGEGPDTAKPMLDGLRLLKKSLEMVDDHKVMLLHVG